MDKKQFIIIIIRICFSLNIVKTTSTLGKLFKDINVN